MTKPTEILLNEPKMEGEQESIADLVRKMIVKLGEDPNREGLRKTPERYETALKFLTSGYQQNMESLMNGATFSVSYDEMVVVKDKLQITVPGTPHDFGAELKRWNAPLPLTSRNMALMMPAVTVASNPNGDPMATDQSPTSTPSELPICTGVKPVFSILSTAISVSLSVPMTRALYSTESPWSFTLILSILSTTWLLVMM